LNQGKYSLVSGPGESCPADGCEPDLQQSPWTIATLFGCLQTTHCR